MVTVSEAKRHVGTTCKLSWYDRTGRVQSAVSSIYEVTFMPLYGACLATDDGDLPLDHIVEIASPDARESVHAA